MTTNVGSTTSLRRVQQWPLLRSCVAAVALAVLGMGCSSSTENPPAPKDAALDTSKDLPRGVDSGYDASGIMCSANGQSYAVGQTVVLAGECPITCKCQSNGSLGQCTAACVPDGGGLDGSVACLRGGKSYSPGETIPLGDGCGGSCICLADGTVGGCSAACLADGGVDAPVDSARDVPFDGPVDRNDRDLPADTPPIDTACAVGSPCSLASGGKGLCVAGTCKACSGATDDSRCSAMYGVGTICAGGECVAGTCHDSSVCTGSKVCDGTHTCRNCASDLQCQNDAVYGKGTICLSGGQCTAGTCHTSTDCQGQKLCDGTVHTCSNCTTDSQCQADAVYGSKSICVSSQCVAGTCATSTDCKSAGRLCASTTKICTACTTDTQCRNDSAYGTGSICVEGQCVSGTCTNSSQCPAGRVCSATSHACVACGNDNQCKNDTSYGQHTICLSGACTTGDCHDISSDCSAGRICGSTVPHACGDCSTDAQCRQDARYQSGYICVGNLCVQGDCHDSSTDCTSSKAGLVCGADAPHTCGTCNDDDQCKNDTKYGANTICNKATGSASLGQCVSNACSNTGHACSANASDVCCASKCIPGNCCTDTDCHTNTSFGDSYFCRQNTCTRCDNVTGNSYLVDPINGDDATATGSGTAAGTATAGCSFRTVTRALQVIGNSVASATTITIVGRTTGSTSLYTTPGTGETDAPETLPIQVPANVTLTSKTGPIRLVLGNNKVGFNLLGDKANLQPVASAALTIDGSSHVSASAIIVTAGSGTANIRNVTISNTGDDGIQVTSGTAQIGTGVHVTGAGTPSSRRSGLLVSGGTANIEVAASEPATSFESNTQSGIAVTGAGVLNITGAAVTGGGRTVVCQNNVNGNVDFAQTPVTATPTSTIDGLYSWASTSGDGLHVLAGSKLKVRNSVFQANGGNGIRIASAGASAAANSLANIDLGMSGSSNFGRNVLQTQAGSDPNVGAGLCIDLATDAGAQSLSALGNLFAGRDCTTSSPGAITASASCTGATDLGVVPRTGTTVTVNTNNCTQPVTVSAAQ
jgi:hypothetical protein